MTRLLLTLLVFSCLPIGLFAQSTSYADGRYWVQMAGMGKQIDTLKCVPPHYGAQVNMLVHMAYVIAIADTDVHNGKHLADQGKGPDALVGLMDKLYTDPANLHIPIYAAYQHAGMQLGGASSIALAADLAKLRKANP